MRESYKTVLGEGVDELIEKRSRFIATVKPVKTEAEALEFVEALRKKYWDAGHNVYAYVIEENNIQRYSDDGEPAGTAGMPVFDMIRKEGLCNIAVVVTRYFGGILLGTGGLVHAYSKAAKLGIEAATPVTMVLCREIVISCDYSLLGRVQSEICGQGFAMGEVEYADFVKVRAYVPTAQTEKFAADLIDKTNGRIGIEEGDVGYAKI